jgi:uncharacterized DUF497 family protein
MQLEWDPAKDAQNVARRGFSFAIVERLDWETSHTVEDIWADCDERRYITVGWIDATLYVIIWTPRGDNVRIISARKANARDRSLYAQET